MRHKFIWYPIIAAMNMGAGPEKVHLRVSERAAGNPRYDRVISPLLEFSPHIGNIPNPSMTEDELSGIDINPYRRLSFIPIFKEILDPERDEPNDAVVAELITHVLADVDRICGMCGRDFQVYLVMKELEDGCFGNKQATALFTLFEKRALAEALIMLYKTSDSVKSLNSLFTMIMTDTEILCRDREEIVFYRPNPPNTGEIQKLRFIIDIFLPINFPFVIHHKHTYGVISRDNTMILEDFVL
jgi:hypothetical protein